MVTAAQLQQADPNQVRYVAGVYRGAAEAVSVRCDELDQVVRGLAANWSGPAQAGALTAMSGVRSRLVDATLALTGADQALAEFAESVAVAQNAMSSGLGGVGRSLRMADAADADAARRLTSSVDWFDATVEPAYVPGVGSDPHAVAQWWKGLSPASQRYMVESRPQDVTRLDGIPVDARDEAARWLLQSERSSLAVPAASSPRINAELAGLDTLSSQLNDPFASSRSYLLGIDAANDHAIISVGDPDQATNVVTMVSGIGSGLSHAGQSLDAANNVSAAAVSAAPPFSDTATVSWLDYQAPQTLQQAATSAPAHSAADDLARFDDGMRVTHVGPPAHDTMVGYSYGSTVVGVTAHTQHVSANDIVFVGSPGVGVDNASDLGIDPSHVWATVSRSDPIQLAVNPVARAAAALTGHTSAAMWFGTAPTSSAFGGQHFASDPGNVLDPMASHLSYFDDNTTSLANIVDIVVGRPATE